MPLVRDGDRSKLSKSQLKILQKLELGFSVMNPFDESKTIEPNFFVRDCAVFISGEYGDGLVEYYSAHGPYIHPKIEALAKRCGVFAEWENPACIAFYDC